MSTKQIAGTSRSRWVRLFDDSTATTALAIPLPSNTVPTGTGLLSTGEFPLARFMISGTVATGTINYQIIGWQRFTVTGGAGAPTAWIPRVLASGVATLGTAAVTATKIGTATDVFAHTITETIGAAGSLVFSPGGNGMAWLEVDCSNCEMLEVETDLGTATAASVIYQLGDRVGGIVDFDASIAGTGLATSAHQVTQNTAQSTLKTATDMMAAAGGGIYIRQDSTATLAKEAGGNLAAIAAATAPDLLAITTIAVTNVSATLSALLTTAGGSLSASVKKITLRDLAGTISIAVGGAAVAGTNDLTAGSNYEFPCKAATDVRLIGVPASTSVAVWQEG